MMPPASAAALIKVIASNAVKEALVELVRKML